MAYYVDVPYEDEKPETISGKIGRNIVSSGANAISAVTNIVKLPETLLKHAEQSRNRAIEHALQPGNEQYLYGSNAKETQKGLNKLKENQFQGVISPLVEKGNEAVRSLFPEGYLEPQGEIEENIQDIGSQILQHLSLGLATGGLSTTAQIRNLIKQAGKRAIQGKAAKYSAKSLGYGDLGQLVAEIGAPAVLDALNISNTVKGLQKENRSIYDQAEKIGDQHSIFAKNIKEKSEKLLNRKILEHDDYKKVRKNLIKIYENVPLNEMNVGDAFRLKTNLNELIHDSKVSDSAKKVYNVLLPDFNNLLERASKKFPDFGEYYNKANNIHKITASADATNKFIEEAFKSKPIRKYLKKPGNALGLSAQIIGDHPKEALNYYTKAMKAAAEKSTPRFINALNQFDRLLSKEQKNFYVDL